MFIFGALDFDSSDDGRALQGGDGGSSSAQPVAVVPFDGSAGDAAPLDPTPLVLVSQPDPSGVPVTPDTSPTLSASQVVVSTGGGTVQRAPTVEAGPVGIPDSADVDFLAPNTNASVREFDPARWPGYNYVNGTTGAALTVAEMSHLYEVRDQAGVWHVQTDGFLLSTVSVQKPADVITWKDRAGTGGWVQDKFINGVQVNESRPGRTIASEADRATYQHFADGGSSDDQIGALLPNAITGKLSTDGLQALEQIAAAKAASAGQRPAGSVLETDGFHIAMPTPNLIPTNAPVLTMGHDNLPVEVYPSSPATGVGAPATPPAAPNNGLWKLLGLGVLAFVAVKALH